MAAATAHIVRLGRVWCLDGSRRRWAGHATASPCHVGTSRRAGPRDEANTAPRNATSGACCGQAGRRGQRKGGGHPPLRSRTGVPLAGGATRPLHVPAEAHPGPVTLSHDVKIPGKVTCSGTDRLSPHRKTRLLSRGVHGQGRETLSISGVHLFLSKPWQTRGTARDTEGLDQQPRDTMSCAAKTCCVAALEGATRSWAVAESKKRRHPAKRSAPIGENFHERDKGKEKGRK